MHGETILSIIASVVIAAGGTSAFWGFVKDRKKDSAAAEVAEATVGIDVDMKRLANASKHLELAEKAWDAERKSFEANAARQAHQLSEARDEIERKDQKIAELEARVERIQTELLAVTRDLADLRTGPLHSETPGDVVRDNA